LKIDDARLSSLLQRVAHLPGDYAEIGVFKGATFTRLARHAAGAGIVAHAFDSFQGMDEPTDMDGPQYPKGKMSCGGVRWFAGMMRAHGIEPNSYKLHAGYVPACFDDVAADQLFRFALVDLDQYAPTLAALEWVWPRMSSGGVVVCDDYFPGADRYASAAVDVFLRQPPGPYERSIIGLFGSQLVLEVT
jgi:O-methyltransferase